MIHSAPTPAAGLASGPSHYQYVQPFHLPEVATIGGRRVSGTKARVYWLLRLTAERGFVHPIGLRQGPAGWVPRFLVVEPWSGGAQGDRRLRSLREDGVRVEMRFFEGSTTTLYRYAGEGAASAAPSAAPSTALSASSPDALSAPLRSVLVRLRHEPGAGGSKCLICSPRTVEAIDGRRVSVEIHLSSAFGSPLAPSGSIGDGAYLAELRQRWATGELVAAFRGASLAGVTAPVDPAWCPLPALAKALAALGAEVVFEELR